MQVSLVTITGIDIPGTEKFQCFVTKEISIWFATFNESIIQDVGNSNKTYLFNIFHEYLPKPVSSYDFLLQTYEM